MEKEENRQFKEGRRLFEDIVFSIGYGTSTIKNEAVDTLSFYYEIDNDMILNLNVILFYFAFVLHSELPLGVRMEALVNKIESISSVVERYFDDKKLIRNNLIRYFMFIRTLKK